MKKLDAAIKDFRNCCVEEFEHSSETFNDKKFNVFIKQAIIGDPQLLKCFLLT